jgi:hypothetical protein
MREKIREVGVADIRNRNLTGLLEKPNEGTGK